eukprot:CAMPEP_0183299634 /NCGR_PEP_ID=MMETSP0160_2-20130417/6319_1 /TAXON_ID=2839 ORGANISM="Odontella Sinensis, Strain Grunow 1884" /NCGR_SAMPLE_ID=MMETSP0160_2 /ASSEMBLY_ACC=CAM_ASM_000250 /LENGTH=112 /DNA_ID=CAMNT_0025461915 /DNA_START=45 /DNA_END=383 /DNA_ORIENTATION=-
MVLTSNAKLQEKLDQLVALATAGDKDAFVRAFVPLDLTEDELKGYLDLLKTDDSEWENLKAEIQAIAEGRGVQRIAGDQVQHAVFHFVHPMMAQCDREVGFDCVNDEWRAQG